MTRAIAQTYGLAVNAALLVAILAHNLTYPLSSAGGFWPAVFYVFYACLYTVAIWGLSADHVLRSAALVSGVAVLLTGLWNSYWPNDTSAPAVFVASIAYHGLICLVLSTYTFRSKAVMTDVVLAAASLYLVIGSGFAAIFALIEWLLPGSFASSSGAAMTWQLMVYYSYVTLTTVGYGDIVPVGVTAQAFAAFEAVVGVLYTVILLSRLVGLHASSIRR